MGALRGNVQDPGTTNVQKKCSRYYIWGMDGTTRYGDQVWVLTLWTWGGVYPRYPRRFPWRRGKER
jgi:hypothetical protein